MRLFGISAPRLIGILAAAVLGLLTQPALAAQRQTPTALPAALNPSDQELATFFDRIVGAEVKRSEIPGASLIVVRDGRVIFAKGYGYADLAARKPVTVDLTLIRQFSITKILVWLLAMELVEEGRLDLDRDVNTYLDFRIPDAFGKPITMRHLMTHTAGFADLAGTEGTRGGLRDELIANLPRRVYAPGAAIAYSNYGAALAAHVVERLRGQSLDQLVATRIFGPAGMTRSTIADPLPPPLMKMTAHGYGAAAREPVRTGRMGELTRPVGALTATPADMGRFLGFLLGQAAGGTGGMLKPETFGEMVRLQKPLGPGLGSGMGLGFIVGEHKGVSFAGHGGTSFGGATDLQLLPQYGIGWQLAFNGRGYNGEAVPARARVLRAVIERFFAPGAGAVRPHGPSTAEDVEGVYLSTRRPRSAAARLLSVFGMLSVTAEADGSLKIDNEGAVSRWLPQGPDRFLEPKTGVPLVASRDGQGEVIRIASPLLHSVAQYEPAPLAARLVAPIILLAFPIVLAAALWQVLAKVLLRRPRAAGPARLARPIRSVAKAGPWLIVLAVLAWPAALLSGAMGRDGVALALGLLSLATVLAALAMFGAAALAWKDTSRPLWHRLSAILVALAALALAAVLVTVEFAGF